MIEIIVDKNSHDLRVDNFIRKKLNLQYSLLQKIFRKDLVKCNNKKIAPASKIKENDTIHIRGESLIDTSNINMLLEDNIKIIPNKNKSIINLDDQNDTTISQDLLNQNSDSLENNNPIESLKNTIYSENLRIKNVNQLKNMIIFESQDLLVINKPNGIPVQLGSKLTFSLENLLKSYLKTYYLLHRLDKNTSGIVLIAKNIQTAREINLAFKERTIEKIYISVVKKFQGSTFQIPASGKIENYIMKSRKSGQEQMKVLTEHDLKKINYIKSENELLDGENYKHLPKMNVVEDVNPQNKFEKNKLINNKKIPVNKNTSSNEHKPMLAISNYKLLSQFSSEIFIVEFKPVTGRTHQLRIHASEGLKAPIIGDYKYGYKGPENTLLLHAYKISVLGMEFVAPIPLEIQSYMKL